MRAFLLLCLLLVYVSASTTKKVAARVVSHDVLRASDAAGSWVFPQFTEAKSKKGIFGDVLKGAAGGALVGAGAAVMGSAGVGVSVGMGGYGGMPRPYMPAPTMPFMIPQPLPALSRIPTTSPPNPSIGQRVNGASNLVQSDDEQCVVCQFLLQKVQAAMAEFVSAGDVTPTLLQEKTVTSATTNTNTVAPKPTTTTTTTTPVAGQQTTPTKFFFLETKAKAKAKAKDDFGGDDRFTSVQPGRVGEVGTPNRFRMQDTNIFRPPIARFDSTALPYPNPLAEQERFVLESVEMELYNRFQGMCASRLPERYTAVCNPLMSHFRVVMEGLRYGDRPDQICMRMDICPPGCYLFTLTPHAVLSS